MGEAWKKKLPLGAWLLLAVCFGGARAADVPRYEAMFVDGRRVEGNSISAWHEDKAQPRLESTELLNPGQPLRWLRDRRPVAAVLREGDTGFVEMVGGDRMPGMVVGFDEGDVSYQAGRLVEPQLLLRPAVNLTAPNETPAEHLRILARFVRRVVWDGSPQSVLKPGTLFLRDGRTASFRSLRWNRDGVRLLTASGLQSFAYRELAEVHLPEDDFWNAYYTELALLDPEQNARLVRFHTITGLVLTGSTARAKVMNNGGSPDHWYHMLQPAWSLDALWVPFATIQLRQYFAPHEVPLSRLLPTDVVQKSFLGGGWRWQADRNAQEGPLASGGLQHGWGFGVHAFSELSFRLPGFAKSFRTRIGIDQAAGEGGCVRTRIFAATTGSKRQQLFQSDPLVGSARGLDSGELPLPAGPGDIVLTLQADAAHEDRPAGADPLDIRDVLDWLEPLVQLDPALLQQEVAKRRASWIPAWAGWNVEPLGNGLSLTNLWQPTSGRATFAIGMRPGAEGVLLRRELELSPNDRWLLLAVRRTSGAPAGVVQVRIADEPVGEFEIPFSGNDMPKPITVPVAKYAGHKVEIELEQREAERPEPVVWTALTIASQLPTTRKLLEDDARGLQPNPLPTGLAQLIDDDPYSGARCLRLSAHEGEGVTLADVNVRIREKPLIGEFRYLRFAVRMRGNMRLGLECLPSVPEQQSRKYDVGVGPPAIAGAARISASAPTEWFIITQDLYAQWGAYDLQSIRLLAAGEASGEVLVDYVYLARQVEDFQDIGAQDPLTLEQRAEQAQLGAFASALEKARAATVRIEVDGLVGTGVLITKDGFVATTGYSAIAPGKEASVTLADGQTLSAITLGIARDVDAAMLKITAEGEYPFVETGNSAGLAADGRLAAVAFPDGGKKPAQPSASIIRYRAAEGNSLWVALLFERAHSGAPLVDREGKLMGIVSRPFGPGGTLVLSSQQFTKSRDRISRSETWGEWPLAVTPQAGFNVATREEKLKVSGLVPAGPAAAAGVQLDDELTHVDGQPVKSFKDVLRWLSQKLPGEKAALQLQRNGQQVNVEFTLPRRG